LSTIFEQNLAAAQAMIAGLAVLEPEVTRAAGAVADTLLSGHKLLACGNGGSAADASHLTTEFVGRYDRDRRPYPAISLATHGGDLTAIANDYTFDELFARQVRCFAQPGDLLIVFTTSGQSENVYRALLAAREMGVGTIAFLGGNGAHPGSAQAAAAYHLRDGGTAYLTLVREPRHRVATTSRCRRRPGSRTVWRR
jgi:D-sedoheptulose 7-phosphate isomerase